MNTISTKSMAPEALPSPGSPGRARQAFAALLAHAGIAINGDNPWDIQVHNEAFYRRVIAGGSLALGESYMDGWWSAAALDQLFHRILKARLDEKLSLNWRTLWLYLSSTAINMQSRRRSRKVAEQHYDLGNDFYMSFLDPYNQYTCGYFKDTAELNKAQEQKLDLICRKLQLRSADRVLDIGCGWGGFARFAATHYGCRVTGITISDEQIAYARDFCQGLPVSIRRQDYRDLDETFDKVLICGMIEHVGYKNYRRIFEVVHRNLAEDGLFLLHTIGRDTSAHSVEPWTEKYIFPNSMAPSPHQLSDAAEGLYVIEDWHNFGQYYDPTLMAWHQNFERNWPAFEARYGSRFYRMWKYYLLSCAGAFRARKLQLFQVVMSKQGVPGGYLSVR